MFHKTTHQQRIIITNSHELPRNDQQNSSESSVMFSEQQQPVASFHQKLNQENLQEQSNAFQRNQSCGFQLMSMGNQLNNIKKIAALKVKIELQNLTHIFSNKIIGIYEYGFDMMQNSDNHLLAQLNKAKNKAQGTHKTSFRSIQTNVSVTQNDQQLFVANTQLFHQKLNNFIKNENLKQISNAFWQIMSYPYIGQNLPSNTNIQYTKSIENSQSIVSPYRVSLKYDNNTQSQRNDSEWDIGLSQGGLQANEIVLRENKFLRKKKQKNRHKVQSFKSKMDQLLSFHESFLDNIS